PASSRSRAAVASAKAARLAGSGRSGGASHAAAAPTATMTPAITYGTAVERKAVRISEAFKLGRPVYSFEFFPPKTDQAARDLFRTIDELQVLRPTFVTVTYGAGGSTRERTIELATELKHRIRIEVAAHLTCVGHTAPDIARICERLRANGIENVMALRGDPPRGDLAFKQVEGGFAHATELIRFIKERFDFCVGAAAYPEKHPESISLEDDL